MENIFAFDDVEDKPAEETKEKRSFGDHDGLISMGMQVNGSVKVLDGWRFATGNLEIANDLSEMFNAPVIDTESPKEEHLDVRTDATVIPVIVESIYADRKQFVNNKLKHHCNGKTFLSGEDLRGNAKKDTPCGCPTTLAEAKALAKEDEGPKPAMEIKVRLARDPELGVFLWKSGSWGLATELYKHQWTLANTEGPQLFEIEMEKISWLVKDGKDKGKTRNATMPILRHVKSMNDAIADDPDF